MLSDTCPACGQQRKAPLALGYVLDAVCRYYGCTRGHLVSGYRPYARHAQVAMFLAREHTALRVTKIARELGRCHSTVVTGHKRIAELIAADPETRHAVAEIEKLLGVEARL